MKNRYLAPLSVALLTLGLGGLAAPARAELINFDPDGKGSLPTVQISGFDLAPGNVLAQGALPLVPGSEFQLYYQAKVTGLLMPSGPLNTPGLNTAGTPFQLTVIARVTERVVSVSNATQIPAATFQLSENQVGSFFQVYYHSAKTADNLAGTGFNQGTLILAGVPTNLGSPSGSFRFATQNGITPLLTTYDNLVPSNYSGPTPGSFIQSVTGSGSAAVTSVVTYANPDFFVSSNLPIIRASFGTNIKAGFDTIEPSRQFLGVAPNIGLINGLTGPDFQFQADGIANFATPEPAGITLMGLGLVGCLVGRAYAGRRKAA